ncbi:ferritin family protein [Salmonella enterica subsp. enterica serovar Paratyphi A]|uniref:Ferritin n=2 Tax=cellular organisms TaxID=131567 RepID=A0A2I5R2N2_MACRS|nr:ferritin [Klebsiella pneumoniae]AUG69384.1 Ferritin [Macrobrachium rosenbergii]
MASQIRQNYHEDCEAAINKQINMELYASYVYLAMSSYYARDDVALPGLKKFFKESSDEEREHAEKLMEFQNKRGGTILLQSIACPSSNSWGGALDGLQTALDLEKKVNQSLLDLHKISTERNDPHLNDFLEENYLKEQVEAIHKIGCLITRLKRAGPGGLGEYLFDKSLE